MAQNLVILYADQNGHIAYPLPQLMQNISRLDVNKVMFVGSPDAEAQTLIASLKTSGVPVEIKPKLTYEEDQQFALTYNVTAFPHISSHS